METTHNHDHGAHDHNHDHGTHNHSAHNHPHTSTKDTAGQNMLMGILAYLGILVIIPFLIAKDDPFVKFHIKQGLVLVVIETVMWFIGHLGMMVLFLLPVIVIINIGTLLFSLLGIINVIQGTEKELPFIGKYSSYFKF